MPSNGALNALAVVIAEIRPEWETPGIVAALRKLDDQALHHVALAAIRYAADETNLTPGNLPNLANRAWDADWWLPCKTHPTCRGRRLNGECADCWTDRNAALEPLPLRRKGAPIPDEARVLMLAAFHHEPTGETA